jgi:hypothetical protein
MSLYLLLMTTSYIHFLENLSCHTEPFSIYYQNLHALLVAPIDHGTRNKMQCFFRNA